MAKKHTPSFFDVYPGEYDALTDASARAVPHGREVDELIARFLPRTVLDAGCATGLTSALFAERGIRTVGLDRSKPMLDLAREKYAKLGERLTFTYGRFEKFPKSMTDKFDMIVCLANAIVGVQTVRGLREALGSFYRSLSPGGTLVLQLLNYSAIAEGRLFPVKATHIGQIVYERFSERRGKRFGLYVTRADLSQKPVKLEVFRHEYDNFEPVLVGTELRRAGFIHTRKWGNLTLDKPFRKDSRDLVLVAGKPAA